MASKILIVDDDEMVLMALDELLKPEGYDVTTVSNGKEALNLISENRFDLMMFDIVMPEMDGFELCRRVRERKECEGTPVVFLTAKSREEDRKEGLEAGADLFLSKPISPDKLLSVVADTLG